MGAGLILTCAMMSFRICASEPDWFIGEGVGWRSKASALDTAFLVTVDGQLINPTKASPQSGNASTTTAKPNNSTVKSVIKMSVNTIAVSHETKLDSKRNALCILDVLTNNDSKEKRVRVEFNTMMRSNSKVKYNGFIGDGGEVVENGNSVPQKTHAIILLAELPDSQALPLFLWGDRDAQWPVSIRDVGSSVRLSYEGVIKPGEKAALVHWVATAGLDKSIKLERTFDLFLKNGKVLDPMIDAEVLPYVVNFKPESLTKSVAPDTAPETAKLVALDKLCEKLGIKRGDKDILWMSKDEVLNGTVEAEKINFSVGDHSGEIDWKDVAAVRGGGGRGREQRLYLRNGSVLDGRVKFSNAKLTGDIGTMTLDGDALELLLGQTQPEDGKPAEGVQGFVQTLNGRQFWIKESKAFTTKLVSLFGVLSLDSDEVWQVQRKTEPPYHHTVTLVDGNRINGVLAENMITADIESVGMQALPVAELSRWGTMDAWRKDFEVETAKAVKAEPPSCYCWLRDGSLLVGTLTEAPLLLRANHADITIRSSEVARMVPVENDSSNVAVELLNGTKFKGRFLQDTLSWQLGKQVVSLPVGLITELVRKEKP